MVRFPAVLMALSCLYSCTPEAETTYPDFDLMRYGMPIVIKAPADATVKQMDLLVMKDLTVVKGDTFSLQIFQADIESTDLATIKARLVDDVKSNPYFFRILQDDPAGFIYENKVDTGYVNYGFRHIRIQGDKEYIFQQGLRGKFSRNVIETMYLCVQ